MILWSIPVKGYSLGPIAESSPFYESDCCFYETTLKKKNGATHSLLIIPLLVLLLTSSSGPLSFSSSSNGATEGNTLWTSPEFQAIKNKAKILLKDGRLSDAAALYESGLQLAQSKGDKLSQARFLGNLGSIRFGMLDFRSAAETYNRALEAADSAHDEKTRFTTLLMLSSLYLNHGDLDSAASTAAKAKTVFSDQEPAHFTSYVYAQLGQLEFRKDNPARADFYFHKAISLAAAQKDLDTQTFVMDQYGFELVKSGALQKAERVLGQAYHLRKNTKGADLCPSFSKIGVLRYKQGHAEDSIGWLNSAAACKGLTQIQTRQILHYRGLAHHATGNNGQALTDLSAALDQIRLWKLRAIPVDSLRSKAEEELQEVYDSYLSVVAGETSLRTNPKLMWESFFLAQENHAWSFRELRLQPNQAHLPSEYFEVLDQLRSAESMTHSTGRSINLSKRTASLKLRLREIELKQGFANLDLSPSAPQAFQKKLLNSIHSDEALISFHISAEGSMVWAVTKEGITLGRLAPQGEIREQVEKFLNSVREDKGVEASGGRLFSSLFGQIHSRVEGKKRWLLILDRDLFSVPFAALSTSVPARFLVEEHSLRIMPGVFLQQDEPVSLHHSDGFLGVGDAIYNRADPRFPNSNSTFAKVKYPLSRLPATAAEISNCALRLKPTGTVNLLTGAQVNTKSLRAALSNNPHIIHIAAHFVTENLPDAEPSLALGVNSQGVPELVSPKETATFNTHARLVVLNGCGSGSGPGRPGSGLMGLTRAWLAAGVQTTIASLWPTPDDTGEMFLGLYERISNQNELLNSPQIAEALRQSQLSCLRSKTFRSKPKYWSAFFVVGKG